MKKIALTRLFVCGLFISLPIYAEHSHSHHEHHYHEHTNNYAAVDPDEAAALLLVSSALTSLSYISYTLFTEEKQAKMLTNGKADASLFIATQGTKKGIYLTSLLEKLRTEHQTLEQYSDLQLAQAILIMD